MVPTTFEVRLSSFLTSVWPKAWDLDEDSAGHTQLSQSCEPLAIFLFFVTQFPHPCRTGAACWALREVTRMTSLGSEAHFKETVGSALFLMGRMILFPLLYT